MSLNGGASPACARAFTPKANTTHKKALILRLSMGLDEPEQFVYPAGNFREQICRVHVAILAGGVNRSACRCAEFRQRAGERSDVFFARCELQWVGAKPGILRDCLDCPERDTAELHGALCDLVGKLVNLINDLIEQLVQGDKV